MNKWNDISRVRTTEIYETNDLVSDHDSLERAN